MRKKSGASVGEMQNKPLSAWTDDEIIAGLQFFATLQLRTPLRVLQWHGKLHTDRDTPPPQVAQMEWEGIWLPKTKTWKELGGAVSVPPVLISVSVTVRGAAPAATLTFSVWSVDR